MNYSQNESSVRVDIWRESGQWYDTIAIDWDTYSSGSELIHEVFKRCLFKTIGSSYQGMTATCLEPFHEFSHPLMIKIPKGDA